MSDTDDGTTSAPSGVVLFAGGTDFENVGAISLLFEVLDESVFSDAEKATIQGKTAYETRLVGLTRFCTFTVWCWCLQCLFFSLTLALHLGLVPKTPMLIRAAVIMFEVSLSTALLVSSVVTFVLIPIIIREKNDASGFFTLPALMMHNANIFFMVSELVFSQVEVELAHLPFSVLFGIVYIMFSWVVAHRIGFFFYFFINYNFKYALASHVLLLTTLGVFYAVASVISHSFNPEQNALSIPVLVLSSMMLCTIRAPASNLKNA